MSLDETAGGTENSPDLIVPDTNAGTKRWVLASSPSRFWNISTDPTVNSDESIGVKPGDIWKNGANLWVCNSAVDRDRFVDKAIEAWNRGNRRLRR